MNGQVQMSLHFLVGNHKEEYVYRDWDICFCYDYAINFRIVGMILNQLPIPQKTNRSLN